MDGRRHRSGVSKCFWPLISILALAVLVLAAVLWRQHDGFSPGPVPQEPHRASVGSPVAASPRVEPGAPANVAAIVGVWQKLSREAEVPEQTVENVSVMLRDVVAFAGPEVDEESLALYEGCLKQFLQMHRDRLVDDGKSQGTGYWLSYCTVEAFLRHQKGPELDDNTLNDYQALSRDLADALERSIRQQLSEDEAAKMQKELSGGLAKFREEFYNRAEKLHNDFLCPAFKTPLTPAERKQIAANTAAPDAFRSYEEWNRNKLAQWSRAELLEKFLSFSAASATHEAFWLFVKDKVARNRYWGDMHVNAVGDLDSNCYWPAWVTIEPDETRNKYNEWRRR